MELDNFQKRLIFCGCLCQREPGCAGSLVVLFLAFACVCLFKNAFGQSSCVFPRLESKVVVVT